VPIVYKSGSLNLLESYRPVQACNGIALPLHLNYAVREIRNMTGKNIKKSECHETVSSSPLLQATSLNITNYKIAHSNRGSHPMTAKQWPVD
jgi:hypothetical protein